MGPLPPPAGAAVPGPEPTSTCGEVASGVVLVVTGTCGEGEGVIFADPLVPAIGGVLDMVDGTSLVERAREEGSEEDDGTRCGGCRWVAEGPPPAPAPAKTTESNDVLAVDGTDGDKLSLPFKLDVPVPVSPVE
jgi:hypothetical protein